MIYKYLYLTSLSICLFYVSCTNKVRNDALKDNENIWAKGFVVQSLDSGLYCVDLYKINSSDTAKYQRYYFINRKKSSKKVDLSDGYTIEIPIKRVVLGSTTHIGYINILGEQSSVIAIANAERVYDANFAEMIRRGDIKNVGEGFDMDNETLMMLGPDYLILSSGYNEQRLQTSNNVLHVNEWLEQSAMARADWIRFFGCLYDKYDLAQEYINNQQSLYISLCDSVKNWASTSVNSTSKKVITGEDFRGIWYMPYADNWLARLITDAGGHYSLHNQFGRGSISRSLEDVYVKDGDADIWIGLDTNSLSELLNKEPRYKKFKAFQLGNLYHYKKRALKSGGNDFWESAVVQPVELLSDFVKVIFPEQMAAVNFMYIDKLKD